MFVSAALELKFHHWPRCQEDLVYKSPILSRCTCASWSKDNSYLIYLTERSKPEILSLKDPSNIKLVHTITAIDGVSSVCFQHKTKRYVAVGTINGQVLIYDTKTKAVSKFFPNVPYAVKHLDFSAEDEHLAVSTVSGNVVLYDVTDGHVCGNYAISERGQTTSLRFHPNKAHILAASTQNGTLMLWDTNTANKTFFAQIHTSSICGIAFGKQNNDVIISIGEDNRFRVHDLHIRECVFESITQHPMSAIDVSPDGTTVAVGFQDGMIYQYDIRNLLQPVTVFQAHDSNITKIVFQNFPKKSNRSPESSTSDESACNQFESPQLIDSDDGCLRKIEQKLLVSIHKDAQEFNRQFRVQMGHLTSFIHNEFHKLEAQIVDKWEMLNLAIQRNWSKDNVAVDRAQSDQTITDEQPDLNEDL